MPKFSFITFSGKCYEVTVLDGRFWRTRLTFLLSTMNTITTQLLCALRLYFEKYMSSFLEKLRFWDAFFVIWSFPETLCVNGHCPFFRKSIICFQAYHSGVCFSSPLKLSKWKIYLLYERAVRFFSKVRSKF